MELIRSSLMLVVDVVGRSDELKCAAFMFLKVSLFSALCNSLLLGLVTVMCF